CSDGVKNGMETDVDCGGPSCNPCNSGENCSKDNDCTSKVCQNGTCQKPTCSDGVKNGKETRVDCSGVCKNPKFLSGHSGEYCKKFRRGMTLESGPSYKVGKETVSACAKVKTQCPPRKIEVLLESTQASCGGVPGSNPPKLLVFGDQKKVAEITPPGSTAQGGEKVTFNNPPQEVLICRSSPRGKNILLVSVK
ncbi:MAG: hypothetical protein ABEJ02_00150, partial [Candidatus Paceibacteria bacterium]